MSIQSVSALEYVRDVMFVMVLIALGAFTWSIPEAAGHTISLSWPSILQLLPPVMLWGISAVFLFGIARHAITAAKESEKPNR